MTKANNSFITNSKTHVLKERLYELVEYSEELKFLVGFFYFSGWQELYESLKDREALTIKILVGRDIDYYLGKSLKVEIPSDRQSNAEKADHLLDYRGEGA